MGNAVLEECAALIEVAMDAESPDLGAQWDAEQYAREKVSLVLGAVSKLGAEVKRLQDVIAAQADKVALAEAVEALGGDVAVEPVVYLGVAKYSAYCHPAVVAWSTKAFGKTAMEAVANLLNKKRSGREEA